MFLSGGASTQKQPSNIFGAPSTGTSTFGQPTSTSSQSFGFPATTSSAPSLYNSYTNPSGPTLPMLGGGLFGTVPPQNQQGIGAFGQNPNQAPNNQQGGGLFGQPNNNNQQQYGSVFPLGGSMNQQQQPPGNSIFGQPQNQQQQQQEQQQQQQQQQQTGNPLGQSRIWSEQEGQLRKHPPTAAALQTQDAH